LTAEFQTAVAIMSILTVTIPYILYIVSYGGLVGATGFLKKRNDEDGSIWLLLVGLLWSVSFICNTIGRFAAIDFLYLSNSIDAVILNYAMGMTGVCTLIAGAALLFLWGKKTEDKFMMIAGIGFMVVSLIELITTIIGLVS